MIDMIEQSMRLSDLECCKNLVMEILDTACRDIGGRGEWMEHSGQREYEYTLSQEYDKQTNNFEELASHPGAVDMRSPSVLAGITERFYEITSMLEFWGKKEEKTPVVEKVVARQKRIRGRVMEYMDNFDPKLPEQPRSPQVKTNTFEDIF